MTRPVLTVLAVSLILIVSTSNAVDPQTISQICSKASNPSLCSQLLDYYKKPLVAPADLKGVGKIVLAKSISRAFKTKSLIASHVATTSDPKLKESYSECLKSYDEALANLDKAKNSLDANKPKDVNTHVSTAQTSIGKCDVSGVKVSKKKNNVLDTLNVALVVSNML